LRLAVEIQLELSWRKPRGAVFVRKSDGAETVVLPDWRAESEWEPILADGKDATRALLAARLDARGCASFVERFGPLFVPVGRSVDVTEMRAERSRIAQVVEAWSDEEPSTGRYTKEERGRHEAAVLAQFSAIGPDGKEVKRTGRKPKFPAIPRLELQQRNVAPVFSSMALAHVRLELEKVPNAAPRLIARPADLAGLVWLTLAAHYLRGDTAGKCRNEQCKKPVSRSLSDGDSMRRLWHDGPGATACAKWVQRHPEDDRYPQLRKLRGAKLVKATRRIAEEELDA
jgi:hypothetical protein